MTDLASFGLSQRSAGSGRGVPGEGFLVAARLPQVFTLLHTQHHLLIIIILVRPRPLQ